MLSKKDNNRWYKTVCSYSEKTVWEERKDVLKQSMLYAVNGTSTSFQGTYSQVQNLGRQSSARRCVNAVSSSFKPPAKSFVDRRESRDISLISRWQHITTSWNLTSSYGWVQTETSSYGWVQTCTSSYGWVQTGLEGTQSYVSSGSTNSHILAVIPSLLMKSDQINPTYWNQPEINQFETCFLRLWLLAIYLPRLDALSHDIGALAVKMLVKQ
jgi:hypothetical protein